MRSFRFLALGAVLVFSLAASQANAVNSVDVDYLGGSTAGPAVGDDVPANVNDILSFRVSVQADAASLVAIGFSLRWVKSASVNISTQTWQTGVVFTSFTPVTSTNMTLPFAPIVPTGVPDPTARQINNMGFFGLPPAPTSTNVFIGTISYQVLDTNAVQILPGFWATDGSVAQNAAATFLTPDFNGFSINAPAPAATLSMLAGITTLALLSLRGRRRD